MSHTPPPAKSKRIANGLTGDLDLKNLAKTDDVHSELESTTLSGKNFAILDAYPDRVVEEAWRRCLANGDMPTHFAAPEYFREPKLPGVERFAILALDPQAADLRVIGSLTGVINSKTVTSGNLGTPQICLDKSGSPELAAKAFAEGLSVLGESAELITVFSWFPTHAFGDGQFVETETSGTAVLDLVAGPEKVFSAKGRNKIRQAIASGLEVRQATPEDVPEYHAIQKGWSDRKGLPCPSLEYQQACFRLTDNRRLFLAFYEGKIVAGSSVRFYPGAIAEYSWNVSLPEFQRLRPNDLLQWRIIEWACQQGIHTYLFGSTNAFALKYSNRVMPTYRYLKDATFFKTHTRKENLTKAIYGAYQNLPPGLKEKLKRLRG